MVQNVEAFSSELQFHALSEGEVLEQRGIPRAIARPVEVVATQRAGTQEYFAGRCCSGWINQGARCSGDPLLAIADVFHGTGGDRANNVRPYAVNGDIERRAGARGDDVVELPSAEGIVHEGGPVATELLALAERKFIERGEDKSMTLVRIRVSLVGTEQHFAGSVHKDGAVGVAAERAVGIVSGMGPGISRGVVEAVVEAAVQLHLQSAVMRRSKSAAQSHSQVSSREQGRIGRQALVGVIKPGHQMICLGPNPCHIQCSVTADLLGYLQVGLLDSGRLVV